MMTIDGSRFGRIEFAIEDVVHFEEGLVGFSKLRHFVLVSTMGASHFRWLQSIDEPGLAFLLTDPNIYVPEYSPMVEDSVATSIGLEEGTPRLLFSTVSIPKGSPQDMTLNLAAPIVINAASGKAKQLVFEDGAYTIRH